MSHPSGTYLAQYSNARCSLGNVEADQFLSGIKVSCLLFDRIYVGASELVSNPLLGEILTQPGVAESVLDPETGILRPVSFGAKDFASVAAAMQEKSIRHSFGTGLSDHAKFLDAAGPRFEVVNENALRPRYQRTVSSVYLNEGEAALQEAGKIVYEGLVKGTPPSDLYQSRVRDYIEKHVESEAIQKALKLRSDFAYQIAFATLIQHLVPHLSVAHDMTPSLESLRRLAPPRPRSYSERNGSIDDLVADADLDLQGLVNHLTLPEVVLLRQAEPFQVVRERIARFSSGSSPEVEFEKIRDLLGRCAEPLGEVASRRPGLARRAFVQTLEQRERRTYVRLVWTGIGAVLALLDATGFIATVVGMNGVMTALQDWKDNNIHYADMVKTYASFLDRKEG